MQSPIGCRRRWPIYFSKLGFGRTLSGMTDASQPEPDRHAQFVFLLNAAHRALLAYLTSLLGNRHDAEDVLQRASLTMWQKFDTFEPGTDFRAWASTIAFFEAKNFLRVAARSRLYFSESLLQTLADERLIDLSHSERRLDALDDCLKKLDDSARQLVQAAYFNDGSLAALATTVQRAPQTLYNKLNHIRRRLAECVTVQLARGEQA
jgi:RNA polymerase sigma-70 factor (ECF subfamily)